MIVAALYAGYWPFPRLRWLALSACSFAVELRSHGRFQCSLRAPQGLSPLDLGPDALIGLVAPPLPPFAGVVEDVREDAESGSTTLTGREYAAVLADRLTGQGTRWSSGDAGVLAEEELRRASARNPTGIEVGGAARGGVVPQPVETRGESLQALFESISDLTGYEWGFVYECGPRLRVLWRWQWRTGVDLRTAIHLRNVSDAEYGRSLASRGMLVRAVGGVAEFETRPSHARLAGGSLPFHNRLARTVESEPATSYAGSVLHAAERDIVDPQAGSSRSVAALTRSALQKPWIFEEQVEFVLPLNRWPEGAGVGSVVGLRLTSARFGAGIVRPCRILGYQADLAEGTVSVIGGLADDAT